MTVDGGDPRVGISSPELRCIGARTDVDASRLAADVGDRGVHRERANATAKTEAERA